MDDEIRHALSIMSPEVIDRIDKQVSLAGKLFGIVKAIAVALGMCLTGLFTVAFWIHDTKAAIDATKNDLQQIKLDRKEKVHDYELWKAKKDEVDTQLMLLATTQQKMLDRQQTVLDRIETRLNSRE